jgi:hypothetical protein
MNNWCVASYKLPYCVPEAVALPVLSTSVGLRARAVRHLHASLLELYSVDELELTTLQ